MERALERNRLARRRRKAMGVAFTFLLMNMTVSESFFQLAGGSHRPASRSTPVRDNFQSFGVGMMAILSYNSMMDSLGPRRRRFWTALRGDGIWEKDFLQNYHTMAVQWRVPDFENSQYVEHLRLGKTEFWSLHDEYGRFLEKKTQVEGYLWPVTKGSH